MHNWHNTQKSNMHALKWQLTQHSGRLHLPTRMLSNLQMQTPFLTHTANWKYQDFLNNERGINRFHHVAQQLVLPGMHYAAAYPSLHRTAIQNTSNSYRLEAQRFSTIDKNSSQSSKISKEYIQDKVLNIAKMYCEANTDIDVTESLELLNTNENRKWDSLDTVEFLIDVEHEFDIIIPDEVANSITTVEETVAYIMKQLESN